LPTISFGSDPPITRLMTSAVFLWLKSVVSISIPN
jgi:hypothetical protein